MIRGVADASPEISLAKALTLFRDLPNSIVVLDPATLRILYVNEAAIEKYGYTKEEFLSMTVFDVTPSEDHAEIRRRQASFVRGKSRYFGPARHLAKDGRILINENIAIPALHNGALVGVNILIDITEQVDAQARSRSIFDNFPIPMCVYDPQTLRFLDVNKAAVRAYGYTREECLNMTVADVTTEVGMEEVRRRTFGKDLASAGHLSGIYEQVRKDGSTFCAEIESDNIPFGQGRIVRMVVARDVTEKIALAKSEAAALRRLEEAQEIAHLGSFEYNFETKQIYLSPELLRIMGLTPETAPAIEPNLLRLFHPDDHGSINDAIRNAWPSGEYTVEARIMRPAGDWRWVSARAKQTYSLGRRPATVTGTIFDVTDRVVAEHELRFLAFHDPLTLLPNRAAVSDLLDTAMKEGPFALFYIDFDGFSEVNDSFGHHFGDAVLRMIADRLTDAIGSDGKVCRWGGDEFVVVARLPNDAPGAHVRILEHFRSALEPVYEVGGRELFITASIGIALYPEHGGNSEELVRNADAAMYEAKDHRNTSAVFSPRMYDAAKRRLEIQNGLHQALRLAQLCLVFQPIVSVHTGDVVSAEALLRWKDPKYGSRFPGEFIEIAEESGLIIPLGEWVIDETCRAVQCLLANGINIPIAVNVSSKQFEFGHVIDCFEKAMSATKVCAENLIVEITESGIMRDIARSSSVMEALRSRGICIALDDFGTGYSSLSHLKSFPIDTLKIDRELLQDVVHAEQDREIVRSVVHLGKATNLKVVAEGVESLEQAKLLRQLGCDEFQGFHFCVPLPLPDFLATLTSHRW